MGMNRILQYMLSPDGRRAMALLFLAGGGIAMTGYAGWSLWMVRSVPQYAFYLGLAAHVSILVVLTGFAGLLVKRMLKANVAGASFEANDQGDGQ
jgi:hypothetical protein